MKLNTTLMSDKVIDHLKQYYHNEWKQTNDFESFATGHLYMLTVRSMEHLYDVEQAKIEYRKKHVRFLRKLLGSRIYRKPKFQPVGYTFLDFAGTRHGYTTDRNKPHFHSIIMIHPDTRARLDEIIHLEPLFRGAEPYQLGRHPMEYVASYAMKDIFGKSGTYYGRDENWDAFPFIVPKSKLKPGRKL